MNRSVKYWIYAAVIILFLVLIFSFTNPMARENDMNGDALSAYLDEQNAIMSEMMEKMTVTPSGNAALDFLKGMIPHHEAAIAMSDSYLKYGGQNRELKDLAEDIIEAQTEEITEMNKMIKELETIGVTNKVAEEGYLDAYEKMMSQHNQMDHGTASAPNVDYAFAEGMVMHHQMAIDMADAILGYTEHEEVRRLADDIIEKQEEEIAQMQRILQQKQ